MSYLINLGCDMDIGGLEDMGVTPLMKAIQGN